MSQSNDEARLRQLIQRLKDADGAGVPDFDAVLQRPNQQRRPTPALGWAVVGCTVALLLAALLWMGQRTSDSTAEDESPRAEMVQPKQSVGTSKDPIPQPLVASIDFDFLHQLVEEHCATSLVGDGRHVPLWTSRTESLLVWKLDGYRTLE